MSHKRCLNDINNALNVISFDQSLKIMRHSRNTHINIEFFLEFLLLSHGFDILGLNNLSHGVAWNGVYVVLKRLNFVHVITKHLNNVDFRCLICKLSPLGVDFITKGSSLKHASDTFFKKFIIAQKHDEIDPVFGYHGKIPTLKDALKNYNNVYDDLCNLICSDPPFDEIQHAYQPNNNKYQMIKFLMKHQHEYIKSLHGKHPFRSLAMFMNDWMFSSGDIMV